VLYCEKEGNVGNEAATELAGVLQDEYEMRPRMVLGSVVDGFDRLYISYNDALHELESERRPFRDMVIKNRADRKREIIFQEVFREFKEAMISNVDDKENVMHIFERFCMAAGSYNLSAKYTERCCFELASSVAFAYLNDSGSQSEENLNALMKTLNGASRETACQLTETFFQRLLSREAGSDHELVRKVQSRIHENLGEDLSVAKIAAELYVTPNYLSRLFKRITGEGCNEYIVRKRIEKAKALLETSTMKIGEIAQIVGYMDMNYFSLAFKKHTGMSPTKYRAQAQCGK
jgi:two-component system response regulator YesN